MSRARIVFICISLVLLGGLTVYVWYFENKLGGPILLDLLPEVLSKYFIHMLYGLVVFYLLTLWYTLRCFRLKV